MTETDVFGVEMPEIDETIFVSVMGMQGEYRCVAVYPSVSAVRSFWQLENEEDAAVPERVLEIPQIHLSFESSSNLESEERRMLKHLGLKLSGNNCPLFRTYKPGFAPWFLESNEAHGLKVALEQLLDVAPRTHSDVSLLWPESDSDMCLVRVPRNNAAGETWSDEFREIPPSKHDVTYIRIDSDQGRDFRKLPALKIAVELDFFLLQVPIHGDGGRPRIPYVLMAVDAETGIVMAHEFMTVQTTMADMWAAVPGKLITMFLKLGIQPSRVVVREGSLAVVAGALSRVFGFELRRQAKLRNLDRAKESLKKFMRMSG
jgi:hypothetical protein